MTVWVGNLQVTTLPSFVLVSTLLQLYLFLVNVHILYPLGRVILCKMSLFRVLLVRNYSICRKMWTRKTPNTDYFHVVIFLSYFSVYTENSRHHSESPVRHPYQLSRNFTISSKCKAVDQPAST